MVSLCRACLTVDKMKNNRNETIFTERKLRKNR